MARQLSLFEYSPKPMHEPVGFVQQGAEHYVASRGGTYQTPPPDLQNRGHLGLARALAYEREPHLSDRAVSAYGHFKSDLADQYDFMTGHMPAGMGVKVETTPHDPYPSPDDMRNDLAQNRRIKVYATDAPGSSPNAVLSNEENDRFRAVHDVFGHAGPGSSFSRNGEEIAYQSHAQMFRPEALPALRSETRGQNSEMIYRNAGTFPDEQRAVALPSDRDLRAARRSR